MSSQHLLERNTTARQNSSAQRIRPSARELNIFANAVNIPRILEKRGFLQRQQTFEVFKKNNPEYDQGISTQQLIQRRVNEAGRKAIVSDTKGQMLIKDLWSSHYHKDILKRSHMNSDSEYFKESTRKLDTTANMLAKLDTICMEKFIENDEESNDYFKYLAQHSQINCNDLKLQRELSLIQTVRQNDKKLEQYDQPDGSMQFFTGNNNMSICSSNPGIYSSISGINKKRNETATSICNYNSHNSCKIIGTEEKEIQLLPWVSNSTRRTSQNSFILEEKVDVYNNPGKVLIEKLENEVKLESDRKRMGITSRKSSSFHKIIGSLLNKNSSQQQVKGTITNNNNSPGKDLKYLQASSVLRHTRTKSSHESPWMLSRNHVSLEASQQEISTQNYLHRRGSTANVSMIVDSRERSPESHYKQLISKSRQPTAGSIESNVILSNSNLGSKSSSQQRIQSQATLQLREHVGELIKKCERFQSENKQAIAVVDKARVVQNEQDAVNAQKVRELYILSQLSSHSGKKKLMNGNNPRIALAKKRRVQTQYFVDDEE